VNISSIDIAVLGSAVPSSNSPTLARPSIF
jgi:hypothetical protein